MEQKHLCAVCGEAIPAGTKLCDNCTRCPDCGSTALTFYDDTEPGEATMECFHCGFTYCNNNRSTVHDQILTRYNRECLKCGVRMGKFISDADVCLCTDCYCCPKCDEQLTMRNDKPYCWFCHNYWLPKNLHKSFGASLGKSRRRCDAPKELSFMQLDSTRNDFTLEEYYRSITEETVDGDCLDCLEVLQSLNTKNY